MTSTNDILSRSGLIPGSGTEQTFFAHAYPASEISILAFTANASVLTVQWSLDRLNVDYEDVVNISAGVGISVRFPTRSEYVALRFVGSGGTTIRYSTGFRGAGASASVLASVGTGVPVYKAENGTFRSILSSDATISVTELAEEVNLQWDGSLVSLASAGGTESLVQDGVGPALSVKGLTAGAGVTLTPSANDITITNASPASAVTLASAGGTESLVVDGVGPSLSVKGLSAGADISLTPTAGDIRLAFSGIQSPYQRVGNQITVVSPGATTGIVAGQNHTVSAGANHFIGGGDGHTISLGGSNRGAIVGGENNTLSASRNSIILGGQTGLINPSANSLGNALLGGLSNSITRLTGNSSVQSNVIAGGQLNNCDNAFNSGIFAGSSNVVDGVGVPSGSVIVGGSGNHIVTTNRSVILGGQNNVLNPGANSAESLILGGRNNSITAAGYSGENCILGGVSNSITAGYGITQIGRAIVTSHTGCVSIADAVTTTALTSTTTNQYLSRFTSGYVLYSNSVLTTGVSLAGGASAWASVCDARMKNILDEVDGAQVMRSLRGVPIHRWTYRDGPSDAISIGPTAQAWHGAFPSPGKDPLRIDTMDPAGVSLAACKHLDQRIDEEADWVDREIGRLNEKIAGLEERLSLAGL